MTQPEKVLHYIEDFGSISPFEAFRDLGIMRLSARVFDLKAQGHNIKTTITTAKNRYGEPIRFAVYTLGENNEQT